MDIRFGQINLYLHYFLPNVDFIKRNHLDNDENRARSEIPYLQMDDNRVNCCIYSHGYTSGTLLISSYNWLHKTRPGIEAESDRDLHD